MTSHWKSDSTLTCMDTDSCGQDIPESDGCIMHLCNWLVLTWFNLWNGVATILGYIRPQQIYKAIYLKKTSNDVTLEKWFNTRLHGHGQLRPGHTVRRQSCSQYIVGVHGKCMSGWLVCSFVHSLKEEEVFEARPLSLHNASLRPFLEILS